MLVHFDYHAEGGHSAQCDKIYVMSGVYPTCLRRAGGNNLEQMFFASGKHLTPQVS